MADLPKEICSQSTDRMALHDSYGASPMVQVRRPVAKGGDSGGLSNRDLQLDSSLKSGNGANHATLNKVFNHTLSAPAQALAESMGDISLPPAVMEKGRAALATIQP